MPSANLSCSASLPECLNGSTAIAGRLPKPGTVLSAGVPPCEVLLANVEAPSGVIATAYALIGWAMFFSVLNPRSTSSKPRCPESCAAASDRTMPPGSAIASSRAAIFTPSP